MGVQKEDALGKPIDQVIPNTQLLRVLETGEPEINQQQELADKTLLTTRMPVCDSSGKIMCGGGIPQYFRGPQLAEESLTSKRFSRCWRPSSTLPKTPFPW